MIEPPLDELDVEVFRRVGGVAAAAEQEDEIGVRARRWR
jgi:hypothetical protein